MKKTKKKNKNKNLFICIALTLLIIAVSSVLLNILCEIKILNNEKQELIVILKNLKEEEKFLKVELEKLQNPDYISRYAREKYLFSKDGEFNIKID